MEVKVGAGGWKWITLAPHAFNTLVVALSSLPLRPFLFSAPLACARKPPESLRCIWPSETAMEGPGTVGSGKSEVNCAP